MAMVGLLLYDIKGAAQPKKVEVCYFKGLDKGTHKELLLEKSQASQDTKIRYLKYGWQKRSKGHKMEGCAGFQVSSSTGNTGETNFHSWMHPYMLFLIDIICFFISSG